MPRKIRPILSDGKMASITLTMGYTAILDLGDIHLVEGINWQASVGPSTVYAAGKTRAEDGNRKTIKMHRIIMDAEKGVEVDHIDGNGLNNRRNNLRLVSVSQNRQNSTAKSRNKSGFKGVSWDAKNRKWRSQIVANGRTIHLGRFVKLEDAVLAYADGSKKYHGEFGNTLTKRTKEMTT